MVELEQGPHGQVASIPDSWGLDHKKGPAPGAGALEPVVAAGGNCRTGATVGEKLLFVPHLPSSP